jgi:hypothetical protein
MSMELHRAQPNYVMVAFFFLGGLVCAWLALDGWEIRLLFIPLGSTALLVLGLLMAVGAAAAVAFSFRPGPLVIGESGLQVRAAGIARVLPWTAVDALVLEPYDDAAKRDTMRLVLVPAAGVDLGVEVEYANKVDGREGVILFAFTDVREPVADVARVLATYAGPRFVSGVSGQTGPSN